MVTVSNNNEKGLARTSDDDMAPAESFRDSYVRTIRPPYLHFLTALSSCQGYQTLGITINSIDPNRDAQNDRRDVRE